MPGSRVSALARLAALPVVILVLAAAGALALLHGNTGYTWPDSAQAIVDGEPHQLVVHTGQRTMLWVDDSTTPPACVVTAAGGEALPQTPARQSYEAAGEWTGTTTFVPTSDQVTLTCRGANSLVALHAAPAAGPRSMGQRLGHAGAALLLVVMALLGVVLLVSASVDRRRQSLEPRAVQTPRAPVRRTCARGPRVQRCGLTRARGHRHPACHAGRGRRMP